MPPALLARYFIELEKRIVDLESAVASGDHAGFKHITHKIAGTGTSYGFPSLTQVAQRAEAAAGSADKAASQSNSLFGKLFKK